MGGKVGRTDRGREQLTGFLMEGDGLAPPAPSLAAVLPKLTCERLAFFSPPCDPKEANAIQTIGINPNLVAAPCMQSRCRVVRWFDVVWCAIRSRSAARSSRFSSTGWLRTRSYPALSTSRLSYRSEGHEL